MNMFTRNKISILLAGVLLSMAGPGLSISLAKDTGNIIRGNVELSRRTNPKDVVVYLVEVPGDYEGAGTIVEMDQKGKIYTPHVLPVLWGTKVHFKNSDTFLHNVHAYQGRHSIFNKTTPVTQKEGPVYSVHELFNRAGEYAILCDVHPEMEAFILVLKNPFFTKLNQDGSFEIADVPEGTYKIAVWSPKKKVEPVPVTVGKNTVIKLSLTS